MGVIVVTDIWPGVDSPPTGSVQFDLTEAVSLDGEEWAAVQEQAGLVSGQLAVPLLANDTPGISPSDSFWLVTERIIGAASRDNYYIRVPSDPPGSRSVTDGAITLGAAMLVSLTADFTPGDVGAYVDTGGITPIGTSIYAFINGSTVQLTNAATKTSSGADVLIGASVSLASLRQ